MKNNRYLLVLIFVSFNVFAIDEFKRKPSCDGNQAEMNACASEQFSHYDSILNKLYKEQINYLGAKSDRGRMLIDAQRAWVKFRDADCAYEAGKQEGGGSVWPLVHFTCLATKTKQRAVEVEEYVKCRENGCP